MSKPLKVDWQESAEELYERYRRAETVETRKRLHGLLLVRRGVAVAEAAQEAGAGKRTVERWLAWYREEGLEGVLRRVRGHGVTGRRSRLTPEQQKALVAEASTGAFRTYGEARGWIQREYGVRYSYPGTYAVLARFGVHPKVPRPRAAKPALERSEGTDPEAQAAWKKGGSRRRSPKQA